MCVARQPIGTQRANAPWISSGLADSSNSLSRTSPASLTWGSQQWRNSAITPGVGIAIPPGQHCPGPERNLKPKKRTILRTKKAANVLRELKRVGAAGLRVGGKNGSATRGNPNRLTKGVKPVSGAETSGKIPDAPRTLSRQ